MVTATYTAGTTGEGKGGARLTPKERRTLLEDIGHIAFALGQSSGCIVEANSFPEETIAAAPARRPRGGAITSPLERLHLLAALWQEVQPALAASLRGADTRLRKHPQSVLLAQAQGGPMTANAVTRSPHLAAAWQQFHASHSALLPSGDAPAPASILPTRAQKQSATHLSHAAVLEPRPALSVNTWANRLAVYILKDFAREAAELARLAVFCEAVPEAEMALRVAQTARSLRAHPVLRDCSALSSRESAPASCANRIPRCPLPYQTLYGAWQQLACPLDFDWTHSPLLSLPALEPWHLYEIWCLLQVAAALHQAGWKLTRGTLLQATPRGLRLVPATGRASRLDFQLSTANSLSLYYQPLFSSANQQAARSQGERSGFAFGSRSHAMQPDIVLHQRGRLYILDPKFKPYAQMEDAQEDVNKMHAYRDAIVRRDSPSRSAPSPVESAWCLFPGLLPGEAAPSKGVYAYPIASQEHPFGTAGVGALLLRPGHAHTTEILSKLLTFLLDWK